MATLVDGLTAVAIDGETKTRYKHWCGAIPRFAQYLQTWGKAGNVTVRNKNNPKIFDCGVVCVFVGYATDHDGDCYRMWDPITGRVHQLRDVIWLYWMYYAKQKGPDVINIDGAEPLEAGKGNVLPNPELIPPVITAEAQPETPAAKAKTKV